MPQIDWINYNPITPLEVPFSSTCIQSIRYVPEPEAVFSDPGNYDSQLIINFTDSTSYRYFNVALSEVWSLMTTSSAGRFFNYQIRDKYDYQRIN